MRGARQASTTGKQGSTKGSPGMRGASCSFRSSLQPALRQVAVSILQMGLSSACTVLVFPRADRLQHRTCHSCLSRWMVHEEITMRSPFGILCPAGHTGCQAHACLNTLQLPALCWLAGWPARCMRCTQAHTSQHEVSSCCPGHRGAARVAPGSLRAAGLGEGAARQDLIAGAVCAAHARLSFKA